MKLIEIIEEGRQFAFDKQGDAFYAYEQALYHYPSKKTIFNYALDELIKKEYNSCTNIQFVKNNLPLLTFAGTEMFIGEERIKLNEDYVHAMVFGTPINDRLMFLNAGHVEGRILINVYDLENHRKVWKKEVKGSPIHHFDEHIFLFHQDGFEEGFVQKWPRINELQKIDLQSGEVQWRINFDKYNWKDTLHPSGIYEEDYKPGKIQQMIGIHNEVFYVHTSPCILLAIALHTGELLWELKYLNDVYIGNNYLTHYWHLDKTQNRLLFIHGSKILSVSTLDGTKTILQDFELLPNEQQLRIKYAAYIGNDMFYFIGSTSNMWDSNQTFGLYSIKENKLISCYQEVKNLLMPPIVFNDKYVAVTTDRRELHIFDRTEG